MSARRLTQDQIVGIKLDLEKDMPHYRIMVRNKCSLGAVQYYAGGCKSGDSQTRPVMREREHIPARPHMMPWATVEMLTQGRARPARVAS